MSFIKLFWNFCTYINIKLSININYSSYIAIEYSLSIQFIRRQMTQKPIVMP